MYVVRSTETGKTLRVARTRREAIDELTRPGLLDAGALVNTYAAVRLLDVADGLRPDDGVPRPVTVKRED
jgi:hypothetical protein